MTRDQFVKFYMTELTPTEGALINPNIYTNPDHSEYFISYHCGEYQRCKNYLIKNRHLLTLEHTPLQHRQEAEHAIWSMKQFAMTKEPIVEIRISKE